MGDKVNDAIHTLMRVVPTRFSGEVAVVRAEIERLKANIDEIVGAVYEYEPEGTALYDIAEAIDNDED